MNTDNTAAETNLHELRKNPYPGRGLILGREETGKYLIQVYWIMGRSENSRNRIFNTDSGQLFTEAVDPTKVKDPSLIIYKAMGENRSLFVVSNGNQTDVILQRGEGTSLQEALSTCTYEPDAPNFTPRITGVWSQEGKITAEIAVLRKSIWGSECDRLFYRFENIAPGFGFGVTTYLGEGNPLPAFQGEPRLLPLKGDISTIAKKYWKTLNKEYRVSIAVKFIDKLGGVSYVINNKYQKVD